MERLIERQENKSELPLRIFKLKKTLTVYQSIHYQLIQEVSFIRKTTIQICTSNNNISWHIL